MSSDRAARTYLIPPLQSFWRWSDDLDAITWLDNRTIVFSEELLEVLRGLVPHGLPPLGSVLLLLAATRDSWQQRTKTTELLLSVLEPPALSDREQDVLGGVLGGLDCIGYLDEELRSTPEAKAVLAQLVLEDAPSRTSPEVAAAVIALLEDGPDDSWLQAAEHAQRNRSGGRQLLQDLRCLRTGLLRLDSQSLKQYERTGLDVLPQPAEIELPPVEKIRGLIKQLLDDRELHAVGEVAKRLMAAASLPRAVSDPDELPLGGVSDLTNRGEIDRLLLSELAYDDLTLAVRVAMNEALYLRRESPPKTPPRGRVVLLDSGIRAWGLPRLFSAAAALALGATTDRHAEVHFFRANGRTVEKADLTTRDGLVHHLAALTSDLHPGEALPAFTRELAEFEPCEPVLITTQDTLRDKEFLAALQASDLVPLHIAAVDRTGRFELFERSLRGQKLLRTVEVPLNDIVERRQHSAPLVDESQLEGLPAIFSVRPFPLLLPHPAQPDRGWYVDGYGWLTLANDRRLMHWREPPRAARQLSETLPTGRLWWGEGRANEGRVRAVVGFPDYPLHLLHIDLSGGCETIELAARTDGGTRHVFFDHGALFIVGRRHVAVVGADDGGLLGLMKLPDHIVWKSGRFFSTSDGEWHVMGFNGRTAELEELHNPKWNRKRPHIVRFFDCSAVDGPVGVTEAGDLYYSASGNVQRIDHGLGEVVIEQVSHDGAMVVLKQVHRQPTYVSQHAAQRVAVDVAAGTLSLSRVRYAISLDRNRFHSTIRTMTLRHRFNHIGVSLDGCVLLYSRKHALRIGLHQGDILLTELASPPGGWHDLHKRSFKPIDAPAGAGYKLAAATWSDGSRAVIDTRGLLHLESSDPQVPQVTLVMKDGVLSGWVSDGRTWGDPYFIGERSDTRPEDIFRDCLRGFVMGLPVETLV